jgi:UDP-N-acetylglucosamine 2-epimerase (non-hydrolysing)/GDP/UDP-N,N'-diacetylbacillosamine 2-epimerase (hydrolysing)
MKKILIVTERRADFSKFKPVLNEIKKSKKLDYYLVVTGSHLLKEHGFTINEIKKNGFKIFKKFHMYSKIKDDSGAKMTLGLSKSIFHITKIVQKIKPDIILAGFDIGANLSAAIVGAHMNILVAHMEGGEVTGTIDESIRHATTKFSHIHFVTHKEAKNRLIRMGENPKFIYIVGNPSLDSIKNIKNIPVKNLEKEFSIDLTKPFFLILQHTVTSEIDKIDIYIKKTIDAIKELNLQSLLIHGNADAGSKKILKLLKQSKIKQYNSLTFEKFINLLSRSTALIGNSSSGIMEAPFLKIPSINIGTRQTGRLHASSVINVQYDKLAIKNALKKILHDKNFQNKLKRSKSIYGSGNTAKKIVKILENLDLKKIPIQKRLFE